MLINQNINSKGLHAAVSVVGVAAAVAALTASSATSSKSGAIKEQTGHSKASNAIASAAALVASHCIEIAEDLGAFFSSSESSIANPAGVVSGVYLDVPAWPGREMDDSNEPRQYFGIETSKRIIQFECSTKDEKQNWIEGLQHMLNCRANMARFT